MSDEENSETWYIVDHANKNNVIRGPYMHQETATEVRRELESFFWDKGWNLCVVDYV